MAKDSGLDNVLVLGGGGREHTLVWKIKQSRHVGNVYAAPGNDGMVDVADIFPGIKADNFDSIASIVRGKDIALTVVGPEDPLAKEEGIVNYFISQGLVKEGHLIFGPTKEAAMLEASKVWAKEFMKRNGIPTAEFWTYQRPSYAEDRAIELLAKDRKVVIKADGLAAGKGAIVCSSFENIADAVRMIMKQKEFGDAGNNVVVERFMKGEEASILVLTDGKSWKYLASSQDHKPVYDNDKGPNTGGMGAYAPAPVVTPAVMERIDSLIIGPTIKNMAREGHPFSGCLYAGLMIDRQGNPRVVEFNVRFGDPETQPVLSLLESDLYVLLKSCADRTRTLYKHDVVNSEGAACCVVMASGGYPGKYEKGRVISGLEEASKIPGVYVFHAGTRRHEDSFVTNGGRVIGVNGTGPGIEDAIKTAYRGVDAISWPDEHHRNDIGRKALNR